MNLILFEDDEAAHLQPLTLTRPVHDLRLGLATIGERWRQALAARRVAGVRPCGPGRLTGLLDFSRSQVRYSHARYSLSHTMPFRCPLSASAFRELLAGLAGTPSRLRSCEAEGGMVGPPCAPPSRTSDAHGVAPSRDPCRSPAPTSHGSHALFIWPEMSVRSEWSCCCVCCK